MNKGKIKIWVKALRSGKYSQTKGAMQDSKGYCCLGVACDVLMSKKGRRLTSNGFLSDNQSTLEFNINEINSNFKDYFNTIPAHMNDRLGMSFDEIADVVEAVYLHGAFDEEVA